MIKPTKKPKQNAKKKHAIFNVENPKSGKEPWDPEGTNYFTII